MTHFWSVILSGLLGAIVGFIVTAGGLFLYGIWLAWRADVKKHGKGNGH